MPRLRRRAAVAVAALSLIGAAGLGTVASAMTQIMNTTTHMTTDEEPVLANEPARNPQGETVFTLNSQGELTYRLNVANIENVSAAHIHLAPRGQNGGVVAWLYPEDGPPGALIEGFFNGTLATGTITDADLLGALADQTVEDLLEEIRAGNAYVNVHTSQNPGGEIRGQIPHHGM